MKNKAGIRILILLLAFVFVAASVSSGQNGGGEVKANFFGGGMNVVKTMPENRLLAASSAVGSLAYHRHLVRPGAITTYTLRVQNQELLPTMVNLEATGAPQGWTATLSESSLKACKRMEARYVTLTVSPSSGTAPGAIASVKVRATASDGKTDEITLEAETTTKRKIYYISIDSLGPEYLKLNAKGTGPGKNGDWLMPNLHSIISDGAFYPQHKAHLVSATDMNHASMLSGAYTGELGLYSVQIYQFGFDDKGRTIVRTTPLDIMYYGKDGKPVTTVFNVVKDPAYGGNPSAFTAYISGKPWVPQHYRNPVFGLDRITTVEDLPEYVIPYLNPPTGGDQVKKVIRTQFSKVRNSDFYLWEDIYTVDQSIQVITNEDPDVAYILLAGVDASGHTYGSGKDLDEWNPRKTPDNLKDDVSRINKHANREGIIKTVKGADAQLGRLLEFLKKRGAYDDSYIIVESDHNMETNLFAGPKIKKILKKTGYSSKKDFFAFTASQMGAVFLRRNDPKIIPALEKALEAYRMKNPVTGQVECPMVVLTREEMRTGIDTVTGERITPPGELYSEYYIEHPKEGRPLYPDMMIFAKKYYQFPLTGAGLGNIGLGALPLDVPPINIFVGGHGAMSTQPSLLTIHGPNVPRGLISDAQTYSSDIVPSLCRMQGYKIPESVQGKGLPKVDPTLP